MEGVKELPRGPGLYLDTQSMVLLKSKVGKLNYQTNK